MSVYINGVEVISALIQAALDLKAPLASPTFTGTVTIPTSIFSSYLYLRDVTNSLLTFRGGTNSAGFGALLTLTGKDYGNPARFEFATSDGAQTSDVTRLIISGGAVTSVATWSSVTHTGLVITSGDLIAGAGTGANGFRLKNLKNATASALSGTQLDIEIDIGGTPYYFTVYPTKA